MSTYAGTDTYPDTTVLPDPGQPALSGGVDVLGHDMADRTTFIYKRFLADCPLKWECLDGINITFSPVFGVVSFDTIPRYMQIPTPTTITAANIEEGISPIGSAFYYIYLYWAAGPKFELSLVVPDVYRMYKSTGSDRVLVGVAQTDATAKFSLVRGSRHRVMYLVPPRIKNLASATPTPETIDLNPKVPPIADSCGLSVNGISTVLISSGFSPFVSVSPGGFAPDTFRKLPLPTGIAQSRISSDVEIPLSSADRKINILTDSATSEIELLLTHYTY